MYSEARRSPQAEVVVWWLLLCRAVEYEVLRRAAPGTDNKSCPYIRSTGEGTHHCALAAQPNDKLRAAEALPIVREALGGQR